MFDAKVELSPWSEVQMYRATVLPFNNQAERDCIPQLTEEPPKAFRKKREVYECWGILHVTGVALFRLLFWV